MTESLRSTVLDHRASDVAVAIHKVLQRAYRVEGNLLGLDDFPPLRRTSEQITASAGVFWGGFVDAALVAVAEVRLDTHATLHIDSLCVDPASARRGYGRQLMHHVLAAYTYAEAWVDTAEANVPAIRLYQQLGFMIARRWATPEGIPMVGLVRQDVS